MLLSIIVIGDELLIGQVTDTNSGWIARNVNPLGWKVNNVRTVADKAADIKAAIEDAFRTTDLVLTTGGLGPTKDDITKQTLLEIFGGKMIHDEATEANVRQVLGKRHLNMNPLNYAQADVPSSCKVIQNRVGTAPIMWFERKDGKVLVAMPGVPFETETMMREAVIPRLKEHFNPQEHIEHRTFVVIDYSESNLAIDLDEFEREMPTYIKLAYLPKPGIIRLRLSGVSRNAEQLKADMDMLSDKLTSLLNEHIVSTEDKPIEAIVGDLLRNQSMTLSTAESCTGGNIAHLITSIAGSSDYFQGSVVSYSNDVKKSVLGVQESTLAEYGAVSEQTVRQMAEGVARLTQTDCAIATSGIAGPGGGTEAKPVGTVWIAVKVGNKVQTQCVHLPGNRERVIDRASTNALIMLIKVLKNSTIK